MSDFAVVVEEFAKCVRVVFSTVVVYDLVKVGVGGSLLCMTGFQKCKEVN